MSERAVYFSLTNEQAEELSHADKAELILDIVKRIEEDWDQNWLFEIDKAWDALHRVLTEGGLIFGGGEYPLNQVVLGSIQLLQSDVGLVSVIEANTASEIHQSLSKISESEFRSRYYRIDKDDYDGEISEDDLAYTLSSFHGLPQFFKKSADAGRDIILTVIY